MQASTLMSRSLQKGKACSMNEIERGKRKRRTANKGREAHHFFHESERNIEMAKKMVTSTLFWHMQEQESHVTLAPYIIILS